MPWLSLSLPCQSIQNLEGFPFTISKANGKNALRSSNSFKCNASWNCMEKYEISEWAGSHPRRSEVVGFFDQHQSGLPNLIDGYDQRDSRVLVAHTPRMILGVLRLIVIPIGPEDNLPAVKIDGKELLQAKVINFFVLPEFRRRRIGTNLQKTAIDLARSLHCCQLASFSYSHSSKNHALKLRMGFTVRPETRGSERHGLYFMMPLMPGGE